MNSKRIALIALLAAVASIGSGCGGISGGGSVSPATFLLPGIGQADPRPAPKTDPNGGPGPEISPNEGSPQLAFSAVAAQ